MTLTLYQKASVCIIYLEDERRTVREHGRRVPFGVRSDNAEHGPAQSQRQETQRPHDGRGLCQEPEGLQRLRGLRPDHAGTGLLLYQVSFRYYSIVFILFL